jgi:hypothetical protein
MKGKKKDHMEDPAVNGRDLKKCLETWWTGFE